MISHVAKSSPYILIVSEETNLRMRVVSNTGARPNARGDLEMACADLDTREHALLLGTLRDMGLAFADGPDWSPAETFAYYRDEKRWLTGDYSAVIDAGTDHLVEKR